MEGGGHIWGMYIVVHFPAVVSSVITLPLDEVLKLIPAHVTVQDCFDFELFSTIDQNWRWRWQGAAASDGVWGGGRELDDREYIVDVMKRWG